eukprot:CAMPEP_0196591744 /NCGR_PEP_ID=MMETSP1081-20130531/70758_1 /TAXON_ID=36882 /ORGANISM="Pyramimonas amylifera, Strain CCMP720" /LENGTH=278 /DNA_ID=CAMNT_0041915209 /DNA_START=156 /DNA_END=993 /DNA_ORIENTATION=+
MSLERFLNAASDDTGHENVELTVKIFPETGETLLSFMLRWGDDTKTLSNQDLASRVTVLLSRISTRVTSRNMMMTSKCNHGLTPWHIVCYYDMCDEVVRALLDTAGAPLEDQYPPRFFPRHPVQEAVIQGNWRVVELIFAHIKDKGLPMFSKSKMNIFAEAVFHSTVFDCVDIGEKCPRCLNGDKPHSKRVSFTRTLDVLVEFGLDWIPDSIPADYVECHPLAAHLLNAIAKQKRAGTAQSRKPKSNSVPEAQSSSKTFKSCDNCGAQKEKQKNVAGV